MITEGRLDTLICETGNAKDLIKDINILEEALSSDKILSIKVSYKISDETYELDEKKARKVLTGELEVLREQLKCLEDRMRITLLGFNEKEKKELRRACGYDKGDKKEAKET